MYALALAATPGLAPGSSGCSWSRMDGQGHHDDPALLFRRVLAMILLKFQYLRKAEKESWRSCRSFGRRRTSTNCWQAPADEVQPVATLFLDGHKEAESIVKSFRRHGDRGGPAPDHGRDRAFAPDHGADEVVYMERYLAFLGRQAPSGRCSASSARSGHHGRLLRHRPQGFGRHRGPARARRGAHQHVGRPFCAIRP